MAFKVLNEEQILLLTENQKEQYENELDIYNARVAFVEQMKKLEKAEIPPFEPKLQCITVIEEIPERDFAKPEYIVRTCAPVTRPEPKFNAFTFDKPVSVVLPEYTETVNVKVDYIQKPEIAQPKLPEVTKARPAVTKIRHTERKKPVLPDVLKSTVESAVAFDQLPHKIQNNPANIPDIDILVPLTPDFTIPVKTEPVLPEVVVGLADAKIFEKFERAQVELPPVTIPDMIVEMKMMEPVHVSLPELSNIESVYAGYSKPEIANARLPMIARADIVMHDFAPVEHSVADLPVFSSPKTNVKACAVREYKKSELPSVAKISAADIAYKPYKLIASKMTVKPGPVVEVKPFAKVEGRAKGLPEKIIVSVPDAFDKLKELLSVKSADDVLEETGP